MLVYEPSHRINAREALLHPYFSDLDRSTVPAYGEEFVGLPLDQLPPELAAVFTAAAGVGENHESENVDLEKVRLPHEFTVALQRV